MIKSLALVIPLAWRNLLRNRRRTIITLIVVSVGMYSMLLFSALLDAWAGSSRDAALNLMIGSGQIHARGYLSDPTIDHVMPYPDEGLQRALSQPDVSWTARIRVPAIVQSEYKILPVTLTGVMPAQEMKISTIPHSLTDGHYLVTTSDSDIVIGRHLAQRLKTGIGKRIIVMTQSKDGASKEASYAIVGLFGGNRGVEDEFVFTGIATAQTMLGAGNAVSEISFKTADNTLDPAVAALKRAAPQLDVASWKTLSPFTAAIDEFMLGFTLIWSIVMFVLMAIGIVNTQLMAVLERVREFGLLRAIGMKPGLILMQVIVESCLLIGVGIIAGVLGCVASIIALHNGIDLTFLAQGAEFIGAGHVLTLHISVEQIIVFATSVWFLGVAITLWPAMKAARADPVEAMNHAA